jgi:hypothetical protein
VHWVYGRFSLPLTPSHVALHRDLDCPIRHACTYAIVFASLGPTQYPCSVCVYCKGTRSYGVVYDQCSGFMHTCPLLSILRSASSAQWQHARIRLLVRHPLHAYHIYGPRLVVGRDLCRRLPSSRPCARVLSPPLSPLRSQRPDVSTHARTHARTHTPIGSAPTCIHGPRHNLCTIFLRQQGVALVLVDV